MYNRWMMSPGRLRLLVELSHLKTMSAVGQATGYSTSGVSHQIATLEREAGARLVERHGRGVLLTPAGRRLVVHSRPILEALAAAEADLVERDSPTGVVRVAAFTSAIAFVVLPVVEALGASRSGVELLIDEAEPLEAIEKLQSDRADLALVYDYTINPRSVRATTVVPLGREPVDLAVPRRLAGRLGRQVRVVRARQLRELADVGWIANSRSREDDELISRLCGLAGFAPRIGHRVDSAGLIAHMVADGLGIAPIPRLARPPGTTRSISYFEIVDPPVRRTFYALSRSAAGGWPPIDLVRQRLASQCHTVGLERL